MPQLHTTKSAVFILIALTQNNFIITGQVEIDIEMDSGQVVTFKTTPINVAIIMAFQRKGRSCLIIVL